MTICTGEGSVATQYSIHFCCVVHSYWDVCSPGVRGEGSSTRSDVCLCVYVSLHVSTLDCVTPCALVG